MTSQVHAGRLWRGGEPFTAVGVDYHPSVAGCQIWTDWDPAAIDRDFRRMAAAGLNTVRVFVFWRDFEPAPGRYERVAFDRLQQVVAMAADAGLACVLSLFTIWMNGQRLDLPWRDGRSLWLDPGMLARQEAFAAEVASTLRGAANLLAIDLGDEIANVDPATALGRDTVASWHRRIATVLRDGLPGSLVIQANDATAVFGGSPFGVDNAGNLDLIAIHAFPTWAAGSIESTWSYKATNLVAFMTRYAAAYGVAFVDELGSYGVGEQVAAGYLRASTASALAAGAAGVLVWCWQDIASAREPYLQRPGERYVGLHRLDGTPKPAMDALLRAARSAAQLTAGRAPARVALYLPELVRRAGGSYLDTQVATVATFYAYLLLKRAHLAVDIVAGSLDGYPLVICPSVTSVTLPDLDRLRAALAGGAVVYYSMGDQLHGFPGADLAGVELVDYDLTAAGKAAIRWDDDEWPVDWSAGRATPTTVTATAGRTLGRYADGTPAVQVNTVGSGRFVFCAAPLERQLDRPGRLAEHAWEAVYRRLAALAGVEPAVDCAEPEVEIVGYGGEWPDRVLAVNHAAGPVHTQLTWPSRTGAAAVTRLDLGPKDWRFVDRPVR